MGAEHSRNQASASDSHDTDFVVIGSGIGGNSLYSRWKPWIAILLITSLQLSGKN